jgi:hypothetical protein
LAHPDFDAEFILSTDASKVALGAILSQIQDGVEKPLAFGSRQLSGSEKNYSASELEMLALVWGVNHYRCYLYGKKFIVRTDHAALRYLHTFSDNNARLMRWSLRLAEYQFEVQHRPGTQMRHADALSRCIQKISIEDPLSKEKVRREQQKD